MQKDPLDEPAVNPIETTSGSSYDTNNISGAKKAQLIMDGELSMDNFINPPNMPGKKLKAMRDRHREGMESYFKKAAEETPNEYKVGDIVVYRKEATEVLEVDPERGVKIMKLNKKGKMVEAWVHHTKVAPALSGE